MLIPPWVVPVLGFTVGFAIAAAVSGRRVGEEGRVPSLVFNIRGTTVHIHHWIMAGAILVTLTLLGWFEPFTYGVLGGAAVQGFTYADWYRVFYR